MSILSSLVLLCLVYIVLSTRLMVPALVRRYILAPLGLTCPVKLSHHEAASIEIGGRRLIDIVREDCGTLSGPSAYYTPFPVLGNGHLATVWAAKADFSHIDNLAYERVFLQAPDGGTIGLDFTPPFAECPEDDRPILVCVHGLTGGSHESYVRSVLGHVTAPSSEGGLGWRGCVLNYRACAGVPLTSPKLFHAGFTEDLRRAIFYLSTRLPDAPLTAVGFSLGANVLMRYLGEEGDRTPIKAGVALSCPMDLWAGHLALSSSILGQVYSQKMSSNLRELLRKHSEVLSCVPGIKWDLIFSNPHASLYEFDDQVTRVLGGFPSVADYYSSQSALALLDDIRVPTLAWHALNDPITAASCLPTDSRSPYFVLATTQAGGHLGTWTIGSGKRRWLRRPVAEFISAIVRADPKPRRHPYTATKGADGFMIDQTRPEIAFKVMLSSELVLGSDEGNQVNRGF